MRYFLLFSILVFTALLNTCDDPNEDIRTEYLAAYVRDIDGNTYRTGKYGEQIWMLDNLRTTHFRNGDSINFVENGDHFANKYRSPYGSYYPEDLKPNYENYGYLYNWEAVNDSRNIAPEGWHVPSDDEWKEFEMYLGMQDEELNEFGQRGIHQYIGRNLRAATVWTPFTLSSDPAYFAGHDTYAFNAFPTGYYGFGPGLQGRVALAYWWTSTADTSEGLAIARYLSYAELGIGRKQIHLGYGFAVRCIKDQ